MLNRITLVGRLTADPELRSTNGGTAACVMRLAVDGRTDNDSTLFDVYTYGDGAGPCAQYLAMGRLVAVDGRLAYDQWETADGGKRSKHKIVGSVQFLPDGKRAPEGEDRELASVGADAQQGDEIPF